MKSVRSLLIVTATLTVVAASAFAFAQSVGPNWTEQGIAKRVIARVEARLNFTAEQRAEVKAILKAEEPTIVALAAQAKEERDAMAAFPAYNQSEVDGVAQKYAATNTAIVEERAKIRLELRAVLTEEQLEQVEQFKADRDAHFQERLDQLIGQL